MNFEQKATLHNKFDFEVRDAKTNEIKQTAVAYNIILNKWFNFFTNTGGVISYCDPLKAICVGKGTGTLDPTRSDLFSYVGRKEPTTIETVYAYPTSYITKEIRIEANEFNGKNITEVGFMAAYYTSYYYLATHAFLQDSEGNQIAINKTDTDVVIIRGTFYVTYTCSGFGNNGIYPPADQNGVIKWLLGTGSFPNTVSFSSYSLNSSSELWSNKHGVKTISLNDCAKNTTTWRIDYPVITWVDTEKANHTVRTIGINSVGAISLPNHMLFPPIDVVKIPSGTGDGTNTEFKIKAPFIIENSETIYVNNAPLTKDVDYTIDYENNFCDMRENYHTAGLTCFNDNVEFGNLKSASKSSSTFRDPIAWWDCYEAKKYPSACTVTEENPLFFDFDKAVECNRMKIEINTVPSAQIANLKIQYSADNVTWNDVPNMARTNQVWSFDLTFARYWKVFISNYSWSYALVTGTNTRDEQAFGTTFFLGKTVPGLKFTTPPPSGAAIEASYQLELPFKTSNNLLRFTCSLLLARGEGSYARVSTDNEEQQTSFDAQMDYYTTYIQNKPEWEFVGLYSDEGISGTSTKNRAGFNSMIEDALAKKIDLIVTKSISRFARNTVDSLVTIRKLKENGVECFFEKENIYTFDSKGELLITIMSSIAQEESRSISENVTWGQRKRMQDGKVNLPYKQFLGYQKGADGLPQVVEKEAVVVRKIYLMFLEGLDCYHVSRVEKHPKI